MDIGMVGLGRMGGNMVRRLLRAGHRCVVYDRDEAARQALACAGAVAAGSLQELVHQVPQRRAIWLMLPAGSVTEDALQQLAPLLTARDLVIDGSNGHFLEDRRRAQWLRQHGIDYVDVGVSGGVWGLERGYCLMVGGEREAIEYLEPILRDLAPGVDAAPRRRTRTGPVTPAEMGYLYCGPAGAGHFVKMVHNGIEYGLMQAYAEGFELLHRAGQEDTGVPWRYPLPLADIAELWRRGSVVSSWLLDLIADALDQDEHLTGYRGLVHDSGEGRWHVETALHLAVPAETVAAALFRRFRSRMMASFAEKLLAALRQAFGGHKEHADHPSSPSQGTTL